MVFLKKEKPAEGNKQNFNKPSIQKSEDIKKNSKSEVIKPVAIGLGILIVIVIVGLLTKHDLTVIILAIIAQISFIVYLAKILEEQYKIKLKHLKEKEEIQKKNNELREKLEKQKLQPRIQTKLVPKLTNFADLKKYIGKTLKLRFSKQEIKKAVIGAGWSEEKVDKAFKEIE